jgi:hypothetical protein
MDRGPAPQKDFSARLDTYGIGELIEVYRNIDRNPAAPFGADGFRWMADKISLLKGGG